MDAAAIEEHARKTPVTGRSMERVLEIRPFGQYRIVKEDSEYTVNYIVFVPSASRPKEQADPISQHFDFMDKFERDGQWYEPMDDRFWPGRYSAADVHRKHPEWRRSERHWRTLERRRANILILQTYPEIDGQAYGSGNHTAMWTFKGQVMDTGDLDDLLKSKVDMDKFVGWKVKHDMLGTGTLVKLKPPDGVDKPDKVAVRWRVGCGRCSNRVTIYTVSGCHHGAFCYVVDPKTQQHLADLRNQYSICGTCARQSRE